MKNGWQRRQTFWDSIWLLIGHLAGSALVFVALFTFGWLVSCILSLLNTAHPFPPEMYGLVGHLEVWVLYLDSAISGVVLLAGVGRFVRDLLED